MLKRSEARAVAVPGKMPLADRMETWRLERKGFGEEETGAGGVMNA